MAFNVETEAAPGQSLLDSSKIEEAKKKKTLGNVGLVENMPGQEAPKFGTETTPQMNQLPMYHDGGDVPKDQVAKLAEGERVLNPVETHAYKSAAIGNAPPTLLGRIADRAHELYNQGKALSAPEDSEAEAFKEKQQSLDAATQMRPLAPQAPPPAIAPVAADRIHPSASYGARPGEQRIDTTQMTKPLGAPSPAPLGAKLPSYDDGGDVPEDQVAKVHEDEHVLDPEKAEAYRQAEKEVTMGEAPLGHGSMTEGSERQKANTPLGGRLDTEGSEPDKPVAARMNTDNAPLGKPQMDTSMPPRFDAGDTPIHEASAKGPLGGQVSSERPTETKPLPGTTPIQDDINQAVGKSDMGPDVSKTPPSPEKQIALDDQMEAMKSGNLVKLGMSNLNLRMLEGREKDKTENIQPALPIPTAPTARENIVNQQKELRNKMVNGATEQIRFQAEKDLAELNRRTPEGSEGSAHPGLYGKVLHGLGRVGQAALMGTAPYVLPMIPGSQAQLAEQAARGEAGVEQAQKKEQQAAVTKEAEQQPALREEAQKLAAQKMENTLNLAGYKTDPATGLHVPLKYEEMSPQQQAKADKDESVQTLNEAKGHEQEAKAILEKYKADPNNAQNQAAVKKLQLEGQKIAIAAGTLGIHQKEFLRDTYGVDEKGNPIPGVETTEEGKPVGLKVSKGTAAGQTLQTKGVQARNVQDNLNKAIDLIQDNPDLFGKVAGRYTSTRDMIGTDDAAIDRLGNLIHNAALASTSVHGLRGEVAVEATEKELLNHFKNSPEATIAGMQDTIDSMATFTSAATKGAKKTIEAPRAPKVPAGATNEVFDPKDKTKVIGHVIVGADGKKKFVKTETK